jgi:hypothetical protein
MLLACQVQITRRVRERMAGGAHASLNAATSRLLCREASALDQCKIISTLLKFSAEEQQELNDLASKLRLLKGGLLRRISQLPGRLLRPEGVSPRADVGPDGKISITSNWVNFLTDTDGQEGNSQSGCAPAQPLDDSPKHSGAAQATQ